MYVGKWERIVFCWMRKKWKVDSERTGQCDEAYVERLCIS